MTWPLVFLLLTAAPAATPRERPWFVDVTVSAGVEFEHQAAWSAKHYYPETFGAGAALLDLESDGDLDLLLLDSGTAPGVTPKVAPRHRLYLHAGDGLTYTAASAPKLAGLTALGACVGDVDGDGDPDVHVTGLPAGRLLLANGKTLEEAPAAGDLPDEGWSSSCVFLDHDGDGDLDLYAAHYVKWTAAEERTCGGEVEGFASYCPPSAYEAEPDRLFQGDGRGGFVDVTKAAGIAEVTPGKGLGVVAADIDLDGLVDLAVANDETPNHLLMGQAGGRFREIGQRAGTSLSEEGKAQAGMGIDVGDLDGNGWPDLTVTNLDLEENNILLSAGVRRGVPRFRDHAHASGLAKGSLMALGFGTLMGDFDLDGDLDLFSANGHVIPEIKDVRPDQVWAMEDQLFENVGGASPRLVDARAAWLPAASDKRVSRGLAGGDLDGDGDLDLVVTANGGPVRILRNDIAHSPASWVGLELVSTKSAPGAPAAWLRWRAAKGERLVLRRTGGSCFSASDTRLLIGQPDGKGSAEVHWPSGTCELHEGLAPGRYHRLMEGSGKPCPSEPTPTKP
ncbi:MAG: CRTAC1 family protein [Acidobacteriota bacterium]